MPDTTLLFDLDDTVYPSTSGVWEAIESRMERYMHERLNLPMEEVPAIRRRLYQQYGTTLRGLQFTMHVDELEFIAYVHDVPLDILLAPDPSLRKMLEQLPYQKIVFTNADHKHAQRVIQRLQLDGCFEKIIDVLDTAPFCKPMPQAFEIALRLAGDRRPENCVFIDDSPRNLSAARELGMRTVQVGGGDVSPYSEIESSTHARIARLHELPTALTRFDLHTHRIQNA